MSASLVSLSSCTSPATVDDSYGTESDEIERWMNAWMGASKAVGGALHLTRFKDPTYILTKEIEWTPNPGQEPYAAVTVPKGFVTDFASIPRAFWKRLRPDGEYTYAAILHDYLYWMQRRSRQEADEIFNFAMEDLEIGGLTRATIYNAVRVFGGGAWDEKRAAQGGGRTPRAPEVSGRPQGDLGGVERQERRFPMRHRLASRLFLLLLGSCLLFGRVGLAEEGTKRAFVVGISEYDKLLPEFGLQNPAPDARAIAAELGRLGYRVTSGTDVTGYEFQGLFADFLDSVDQADTVVLFLSGHGIEIDGQNFLLPRDAPQAEYGRLSKLKRLSISVTDLLQDLRRKKIHRTIMILDACRDHPLIPSEYAGLEKAINGRTAGVRTELADSGEFLMYSAGSGQRALDRLGADDSVQHSVYVRHLIPLMRKPGLTIESLANNLQKAVSATALVVGHRQSPRFHGSARR